MSFPQKVGMLSSPRVEKGKVYGRGAADMKGSIVAFLLAMESLKGEDASILTFQ